MLKKISIFHFITLLFLLLIVLKYELVYDSVNLLFVILGELTDNPDNTITYLNLLTLDLLFSTILLFIIPILLFFINRKHKILSLKLELSHIVFVSLVFSFLYAPLITSFHPNAQPGIRECRFSHPLSSISILHLRNVSSSKINSAKSKVINSPASSDKIYSRKIYVEGDFVVYSEGNRKKKIEKEKVIMVDGQPYVTKKYFFFGTDELGRDIFSRTIYGARITLFIAFFTVSISLTIGLLLGFFAAYFGGIFNLIISRFTDIFLTIPSIFFVIMILAFWGNSILAVILVLGLTGWMSLFKIVKGEVASIIQKDYFISSQKIGLPTIKLLLKEVVPAIITQIVVAIVFQFSNVILAESALSYLGLGVGLNYPSWGNMILSGQKYMSSGEWLIIIPALVLIFSILAINDFGEKLNKKVNPWMQDDK